MRRRLPKLTEAHVQLAAALVDGVEDRDVAHHLDERRRQLQAADARAERLQAELDRLDDVRAMLAKAIGLLRQRQAGGRRHPLAGRKAPRHL
jgi:hypothetical protein